MYFSILFNWYILIKKHNQNSKILLVGYGEKHKEMCNEDDCPLKVY